MEELKSLKEGILQGLVEEYSDEICTTENGDVYNSTLYIVSLDHNVIIIDKLSIQVQYLIFMLNKKSLKVF